MVGVAFGLGAALFAVVIAFSASAEDSVAVQAGMDIFHSKGNCQACHGWAADGKKMDNQMPDGANLRETKLDRAAIVLTIKCGRPDKGMPAFDKLAYTDDRCNDVTQADLDKAGVHVDRADPPLQQREIDQVIEFLYAKVIGKGPMTHDKCVEFWGMDTEVCKDL